MATRFECDICEKLFIRANSLRMHTYAIHEVKKDIQCGSCDKSFSHQSVFRKYFKNVHKTIKTEHKCGICATILCSNKYYKEHMKSFHVENETFQCEYCNKVFHQKSGHRIHLKIVHGKENLKCNTCKKPFSSSIGLKAHIRFNHSESKKPCNFCEKIFQNEQTLKAHIQAMHENRDI